MSNIPKPSKKMLAWVAAVLVIALSQEMGIPGDTAEQIKWVTMTYLGAQGAADFGKGKAQAQKEGA
jgi:hypothetical protein